MAQIISTDELVTKTELGEFYQGIYPYLNGAAHAGFTPVGTIISVMGTTAPLNYLACNGQTVNIADYPELASYFTAQFGTVNKFGGDGTTTFAVPDLRGEFLRGTGTNGHANQGNGAAVGVHQDGTEFRLDSANPGEGTTTTDPKVRFQAKTREIDGNVWEPSLNRDRTIAVTETTSGQIRWINFIGDSTGIDTVGSAYYTSRPTNTSVLYCIATKNIYIDARYNYSTDEQMVGTWIDSKPLYQKTIDCGYLPTATDTLLVDLPANVKTVVDYSVFAFDGTRTLPIPYVSDGTMDVQLFFTGTQLRIIPLTDRSNYYGYATIRYTKQID